MAKGEKKALRGRAGRMQGGRGSGRATKGAVRLWGRHAVIAAMGEAGELTVDDPELAAEQFASMCKGMGDLERRFGAPVDDARNRERIAGAVEVFCRAYAAD